ncbi:MAG: hypothetical protein OEW09_02975 [Anaerolineae bacterium]|nr:hypothetical protein [Anaerolineae bacterium]
MTANTIGTLQIQGPVVVLPLEEYNQLLAQLREMAARLEDLEDIRDMQEALQTDESEAVNYEDYRERRLASVSG